MFPSPNKIKPLAYIGPVTSSLCPLPFYNNRVRKLNLACFLLVVLAALAWRCTGLTFDSLWLDEGYQSMVDAYGLPPPNLLTVPAQPFIYRPAAPAPVSEML